MRFYLSKKKKTFYWMLSLILVLSTKDISSTKARLVKNSMKSQNFFNCKCLYKLGALGPQEYKTKDVYNNDKKKKKRRRKHLDY